MKKLKVEDVLHNIPDFSIEDKSRVLDLLLKDEEVQEEIDTWETIDKLNIPGKTCPYCQTDEIIRNGKRGGKQRFRCKDCGKTFNASTPTGFFSSKKHLDGFFTKSNRLMKRCLSELATYLDSGFPFRIHFEIKYLSELLLSNIIIHQGCYLLELHQRKGFVPIADQEYIPQSPLDDRTGGEEFYNHYHTQDVMNYHERGFHHLLIGIIIADNLRYKLKSGFPSVKFNIIVSFPANPLPAEIDELKNIPVNSIPVYPQDAYEDYSGSDCRISFHAVREGEIYYGDLEAYKYEAMGMIEI